MLVSKGKRMRLLTSLLLMILVGACSGTGTTNYSAIMSMIDNSSDGSVFVLRDTGFSGSGALMSVSLNGRNIGQIGNGETALGASTRGSNYLIVSFSGIQGIGINSAPISFVRSGNNNNYFIVKLTPGAMQNRLQVLEVTEESFKASF
jgi:hypothetical protein